MVSVIWYNKVGFFRKIFYCLDTRVLMEENPQPRIENNSVELECFTLMLTNALVSRESLVVTCCNVVIS